MQCSLTPPPSLSSLTTLCYVPADGFWNKEHPPQPHPFSILPPSHTLSKTPQHTLITLSNTTHHTLIVHFLQDASIQSGLLDNSTTLVCSLTPSFTLSVSLPNLYLLLCVCACMCVEGSRCIDLWVQWVSLQ